MTTLTGDAFRLTILLAMDRRLPNGNGDFYPVPLPLLYGLREHYTPASVHHHLHKLLARGLVVRECRGWYRLTAKGAASLSDLQTSAKEA